MKFSTMEDFLEIEYNKRLFDIEVEVSFYIEPAQEGGSTDPSWKAYPVVDGFECILATELLYDGKSNELDSKEVIFDEGSNEFIPLSDKLAELFVEKNETEIIEQYKEYCSE